MSAEGDDFVDVNVRNGILRGKIYKDHSGNTEYYSFTGIPYAQPPTGQLRFKNPQPHDDWSGVKDVTNQNDVKFYQIDLITQEPEGIEELLLNVYTPSLNNCGNKSLPVLVYLHQGAFAQSSGCKDEIGPDFLVKKDVILVSVNYRLGIFGFLCLNIPECPGNLGLKDQVMALKWVRDNISSFNGDPSNVTLFGSSAGAACVEYHMLSPMSKGLFHKAIIHSGSAAAPWAFQKNPIEMAHAAANILDISFMTNEELLFKLKNIPPEQLVNLYTKIPHDKPSFYVPFGPVAEKKFKNIDNFITENPIALMKNGDFTAVPTIIGICECEELFFRKFLSIPFIKIEKTKRPDKVIGLNFDQSHLDKIFDVYENDEDLANDFLSDFDFGSPFFYFASNLSKRTSKVFAFQFSYKGNLSYTSRLFQIKTPMHKATHLEDLGYLMSARVLPENQKNFSDMFVRENMVRMWTNFAKYGNPTPQTDDVIKTIWLPLNGDEFNCLDIRSDITMIKNAFQKRRGLWEYIFSQLHVK